MSNNEKKGMISIIIPSVIWGSVGINVRLLSQQGLDPFSISFFDLLIGSVFIYLFAGYKGERIRFRYNNNIIKHLILQGLFFGLTGILLFFSFLSTSISNATFLQQTMPIWVMILSAILLKEKVTLRKITALVIAIIGIFLLFQFNILASYLKGDVLALLSSFAFSGMVLNAKKLKNVSEFTSTFFQLSIACLTMLPFMILKFGNNSIQNIWLTVFLLLFLGIVNTGITQRLFLYGLRYVEASKASILNLIEPMSATIFAFIIYSEKLTIYSFLGIMLIIVSVIIIFTSTKAKKKSS